MKKITISKKEVAAKDQQKLSSYFNLVPCKNNKDILKPKKTLQNDQHEVENISNEKVEVVAANMPNKNKQNNASRDKVPSYIVKKKVSPVKTNLKSLLKKRMKSQDKIRTVNTVKKCEYSPNNSDNDFIETKKQKVVSNIVQSLKSKAKNTKITLPQKTSTLSPKHNEIIFPCYNKENENNHKASPKKPLLVETQNNATCSNNESIFIINLDEEQNDKKNTPIEKNIFAVTPEKTFLIRDDIKITENLNLDMNLVKNKHKNSPPHSTPNDNLKKRKHKLLDSPDIIPSTPQEYKPTKIRKTKSCIENKLNKIEENANIKIDDNELTVPDMIVKSLTKKNRSINSSKNKTIINLSNISHNEFDKLHALSIKEATFNKSKENSGNKFLIKKRECSLNNTNVIENIKTTPTKPNNLLQSTSKFIVTPVKSISPSTRSPHKGEVLKCEKSPLKSKRVLFENDIEYSKDLKEKTSDSTEDCIILPSNKSSTEEVSEVENNDQKTCGRELIDYFANLPSSNEDKKCTELDQSNYIVTRLPAKDLKSNEKNDIEDNINDFIFDDKWDEEIMIIQETVDLNLDNWTYCRVLDITRDLYQNLIVRLQCIETNNETTCSLNGVWQNIRLKQGDAVNILAVKSTQEATYSINNSEGFLVFEPDLMISPTSIVGFKYCNRRGILQEKFRGFDSENKVMIVGTLVHKLLEETLKRKLYTASLIEQKLFEILASRNMINTLYSSQIPLEEIKKEIIPFIPKIVNFINIYILFEKDKIKSARNKNSEDWKGTIHSINDVEESIWCPQLGIKGKVDVTVTIDELNKKIIPLELKTGRASMSLEHRGQIILYIMIMNELGFNASSGLLLYLREEKLRELSTSHSEKRDLLMMRNEFAFYIKQKPKLPFSKDDVNFDNQSVSSKSSFTVMSEHDPKRQLTVAELPEPINNDRACKQCPYAIICTAFLSREKSCELPKTHPLIAISEELLSHLDPAHIDYFIHWTSLITLENNSKHAVKELKDIWRLEPYQREQRTKSICYLNISTKICENNENYIHTFKRTTDINFLKLIAEKKLNNDFLISGLNSGNYVVISTNTRVGISTGFINNITENEITVALERNLLNRYSNKIFHIDTYESLQISNFSMTSIAALLEPTEKAKCLRQLIIDKIPSILPHKLPAEFSKVVRGDEAQVIIKRLNKIQQRAVLIALIIKDYLLIKGMPGTGKTATIVALVQLLVMLDKSVLITSHTHSAVDNVCLRLLDCGVNVLRLGSESRINPQLKHSSEGALTAHCKTVEEVTEVYNKAKVVAVTCLAAGHPLLSQRTIDVCIVDESTQVLQCSLLKALLSTKSFILIGDPDQLPPVVRNPEAVCRGMNESLFERLDNPQSTITLSLQYRMNKTITELANAVTYRGQLLCANDSIGYAVLRLPKLERFQSLYSHENWLISTLDTNIESAVIAIDTGPTWNKKIVEKENDNNILLSELKLAPQNATEDEERKCTNYFETVIIIAIIKALKQAGVQANTIGLIAPYRAQVELLKKHGAKIYSNENSESVEINTVDQYQGRDKDVIIYSCTKSRDTAKIKNSTGFEILDDKRRLTVALTRAKHKLIIVGDFSTLKDYSPFNKLINSLHQSQIIDLNDSKHNFDWDKICVNIDD